MADLPPGGSREPTAIPAYQSQHPPMDIEASGANGGSSARDMQYNHAIKEEPRNFDDEATAQHQQRTAPAPAAPRNYTVSQVPFPPYQKLANPGPLGLISFAVTTFVLGLYQCGAG